jgi:hypothetical protein
MDFKCSLQLIGLLLYSDKILVRVCLDVGIQRRRYQRQRRDKKTTAGSTTPARWSSTRSVTLKSETSRVLDSMAVAVPLNSQMVGGATRRALHAVRGEARRERLGGGWRPDETTTAAWCFVHETKERGAGLLTYTQYLHGI